MHYHWSVVLFNVYFPYFCLNILKDSLLNFCTISILNPYLLPCFDCQIHIAIMITTKGLSIECLLFLIWKRHIAMVIYRLLHCLFSVSIITINSFGINYAKMMRKCCSYYNDIDFIRAQFQLMYFICGK